MAQDSEQQYMNELRGLRRKGSPLAIHNMPLIMKLADSLAAVSGLDKEDLIHEGYFGLVHAERNYDPEMGYTFGTYAHICAKGYMLRAITKTGHTIRVAIGVKERALRIGKYIQQQINLTGKRPTEVEIAEALGEELAYVIAAGEAAKLFSITSTDQQIGEDGEDGITLGEMLPDESTETAEDIALRNAMHETIKAKLDTLEAREAMILRMHFGLDDWPEYTLAEIGDLLGVTRERVRQIEAKALRKLKHPARGRTLREFLH